MDNKQEREEIEEEEISRGKASDKPQTTELRDAPLSFFFWRFLLMIILGILVAQIASTYILSNFSHFSYAVQTLIESCVIVVVVFPLVYYFSLLPLVNQFEKRKRAEHALRKSEERFIKAFHFSPAALSITRVSDGSFIDVNESFLQIYGSTRTELIGRTSLELGMFEDPNVRGLLKERTIERQTLFLDGVRNYEFEARMKSGEVRTILISTEGIELDGTPCILSSISDITESKRAEKHLHRLNRALSVLNKCNQILVHADDETALIQKMCDILVDVGEYRMAWVGYAEPDGGKSVRPVAQAGDADGYVNSAQISWANNERGRGPTGRAIRERVAQVNHNTSSELNMEPWRAAALSRGYRSSIALPLIDQGLAFGALTIYSTFQDAFDSDEVQLLTELANDLSFGITTLRLRVEHERAQEQIREMALFPTLNPDVVLRVNGDGRIERINPTAEKMGIRIHAQLADMVPDLGSIDLKACINAGKDEHIQKEGRLGEKIHLWSIRGVPELGFAFLYGKDITERKQDEIFIRQLSRIVEQTEDTVAITDCNGVIEYVNPAFERLTGYSAREALGKTPQLLKSGLHDAQFYQNLWQTINAGGVFQAEIANRKKNGELYYEVKTITPLRDMEGQITHFVATGKDITEHKCDEEKLRKAYEQLELRVQERTEELRIAISKLEDEIDDRKEAERALFESERRLSRAQEIAHLGSWELDLAENRLTWSDEVYRIFGLKQQEFDATYEAFLEAVHPDDRNAVDRVYSDSIRSGKDSYEIEHRVVRRVTGEIRFVHEKCEHFRNESGEIVRSIGMVHDITERKQAEEQIERSNQKLNEILMSIQDDFYVLNQNWDFVYASNLFTSKVGKEPEDFIGKNIWEIFPKHTGTVLEENFREAMEKREVRRFEIGGKYTSAWYRMTAFPSAEGITVIGTDVTERKKAEDALRKAHDELELRVQERTQELAVANQDLLKEVNERREVERQLRILTTAMESAANGIIITNPQGIIQWTNSAFTTMSGYQAHELIGQNMRILRSGQHDTDFYENMWNTILAGEVWRGEVTNRRKDGRLYVEEQTVTPVKDELGQVTQFIAVKEDITEHKQMEIALEMERIRLRNILDTMPDGVYIVNKNFDIEYINPVIEKEFGPIENRKCFDYFHHQQEPCQWCNNDAVLAGKSMAGEQQYAINKKIYELFEAPLLNEDGSVSKLKILHDITHRKQAEMELEHRNAELQALTLAEQEQRQLAEALVKAAIVLNKSLKLDDVLAHILEQIKDVIPYQLADVMLLEGETFYDASHEGERSWPGNLSGPANRFPLAKYPLFKRVIETGQPALIQDTNKETNWVAIDGLEWSFSFLAVPLLVEGKVIGFVNLFAEQPGFFTQKMCEQLVAFAAHAAVAIQNAWLFEQVRSSSERLHSLSRRLVEVQENERRYISRELHDEAGQLLTSMMVDLRLLEKKASDPEMVRQKIVEMEDALNEVSENLHRVAMALRPASLDHVGLVAALNQHLEMIGEKNNLIINFRAGKLQRRLPINVETVLYRIVQEALTNVIRHAHAIRVDVVLTERDDKLIIIIEDDGVGFDPETSISDEHLGLFGIRERIEMIDGKLIIESAPGKGTTLIVEVNYANTTVGSG